MDKIREGKGRRVGREKKKGGRDLETNKTGGESKIK